MNGGTECAHYEDRYGRCIDCGKTWEQRKAESAPDHENRSE